MRKIASALSLALIAGVAAWAQPAAKKPSAPAAARVPEQASDYETREVEGFAVHVNKRLLADDPALADRVLLHLRADLDEVVHFLPDPAVAVIRTVEIWVEKDGTHETGREGHGMCCHWSSAWLREHGVLPEKTGHVEIMNPADFLAWRRDQPYMTFHEMAHAVHWRLAKCDPDIKAAYDNAMKARLYDAVPRNTEPRGKHVKAYAATNDHEYFAELSEAYFALNDFYPFKRPQLADHDPGGFDVMEKVWGMSSAQFQARWSPREAGSVRRPKF